MNPQPKPRTLADIFFQIVERGQSRVMLFERDSQWQSISSSGFYRRVMGVAQELRGHGIGHNDRVAILAENRPEWTIADFAILLSGAVTVPIYATLTAGQISLLLRHSEAKTAFVSTPAQLAKLRSIQQETEVENIILMDEPSPDSGALSMAALMASRSRAARAGARCPRQLNHPRRSGHHHLHQRHHRRSQGRHAHPRQHRLQSLRLARCV